MNVIVSNKYQALLANLNIDVIKNINGVFSVNDLEDQFRNFFYNKMILDITALEDYENINNIQRLSVALDMNKVILLLDDSPVVNSPMFLSQLVSMGIYNFTKNINQIEFLMDNPNTYRDVASYHQLNLNPDDMSYAEKKKNKEGFIGQRVIGFKNLTPHAGATTLVYILKHHIEKLYKISAVELGKTDFSYFRDDDLSSINEFELKNFIDNNRELEVILIDLNDIKDAEAYCSDIIYLIEPGLIQLNRMIQVDNRIFDKLKGKKIVLNKSILSSKDVEDFEKESGSKVFFNIPSIDDKCDDTKIIKEFIMALGFTRFNDNESNDHFGLFH